MKTLTLNLSLAFFFITSFSYSQVRREEGNMILEDVPTVPEEIKGRIQQYQNTRSASLVDWLPNDGGIMISTRFGNTTQLHTIRKPGGFRNQITFFDEPVSSGSFSPDVSHNGFLFTKDFGGNEFAQLYWYDMSNSTSTMLSDGESVNFGVNWSNNGDQFAFTSTRRNKVDFDIYISNANKPEEASLKIDRGSGYWVVTDWSPDDKKLIVIQYLSSTKSNSYIYDITTNELTQVNDDESEAIFLARAWDHSGENAYILTNEGVEFTTLAKFNIKKGKHKLITSELPWDVENFAINASRTKAAFTANENGFGSLYLLDLGTDTYEAVDKLPIGQVSSLNFSERGDQLGFVLNTAASPGDVYSLDLTSGEMTQWTYSEVGGLNTQNFPKPTLITYDTYDEVDGAKRQIPAFVYKPMNASDKMPVMISIHGGPEGQHVPRFSSFYAFLANELGIAIIAPNVRGSDGYGKTYLKLDNGFNRENSVKDIGYLIDWIQDNPEYDGDRIGVFGGSYGGYMVLSSMYNYNEKLKCGIDVVGISNFVTFLENTEEYRRDLRRAEYGDERDPKMREYLESISPNNHAKEINKPLFVIQGANDPRVPASESEQMVKAIRENGGVVWYMLAKDEGHGFRKKENRDRMTEAIALFLKEHLLK